MTDLTCAQGVELLMEYLEGTLAADLRAAVEAHVAACPRCVAFIESYRRTPDVLRQATAPVLPEDLQQPLLAFLRAQRRLARDED
jgi:anti-sigma factor RsiW